MQDLSEIKPKISEEEQAELRDFVQNIVNIGYEKFEELKPELKGYAKKIMRFFTLPKTPLHQAYLDTLADPKKKLKEQSEEEKIKGKMKEGKARFIEEHFIEELLTMLEFAKRFIEKRGTLPVLKNVCLRASEEGLRLRTSDMKKDFSAILREVKVSEEGAITVNVNQLYNLLKKDKSYMLQLSNNDDGLVVQGDEIKSVLYGIPAGEYIAEIDRPDGTISCSTSLLLEAIEKVSYVITEKSFSPVLTGMLIKQIDNLVHFVGTDSFRLVRYTAKADLGEIEAIVPVDALKAIAPILKYAISIGATKLKLGMDYQKLSISLSGGDQEIVITTLLIQGNYPNYDRDEVIPTSYTGYITVDRQELLQKLPQIVALTTAYLNHPVKLSVEDEELTLSSGKTDNGELSATLSCHCFGGFDGFSVNGSFLLDFLKKCSSYQVKIEVINNKKTSQDYRGEG